MHLPLSSFAMKMGTVRKPVRVLNNYVWVTNFKIFTFVWPCIVTNFFIIKPTKRTNFPNVFWHETLHVSGSSSVHHQEFIHCTLGTGVCHNTFVDSFRAGPGWNCQFQPGPARELSTNLLWHIPVPSVQPVPSWSCSKTIYKPVMTYTSAECTVNELPMMDSGTARNKFVKLVHLIGFIIKKV
jgi:hypothetical protein